MGAWCALGWANCSSSESASTRPHVRATLGWAGCLGLLASNVAFGQDLPWRIETDRLGLMEPVSVLVGLNVRDRDHKSLGKIVDLVLDFEGGRVMATLLPASKGQITALPAMSYSFVSKVILLAETDRKTFNSAPSLPKGTKAEGLDSKSLAPPFQHFGQKLPLPADGAGRLHSAVAVVGATLLSQENEPLGNVKEIEVDLAHGRIIYLVVDPLPSATTAGRLFTLPPLAVQPDPPRRALVLKVSRAHFLAGPSIPRTFATDMVFPEHAIALLKHYGLQEALKATTAQPAGQAPQKPTGLRVLP
jgi:sporulation protein YlmC with PRC-barrel domain